MIQTLSNTYKSHIAWPMFLLFYLQLVGPLYATGHVYKGIIDHHFRNVNQNNVGINTPLPHKTKPDFFNNSGLQKAIKNSLEKSSKETFNNADPSKLNIGGPSSPEATSFKAVGSDNLVNLFTGDFSYSIPLLDVGGYPVNLFYSAGISMDQEASWVGLGWNINPGTVSRNMRGVPDDFNGTDVLTQTQNIKPNRTWGAELGVDGEIVGIKKPSLGLSLGFSYNNYLGPALDLGASVSLSIATIENIKFEKSAVANLGLQAGIGAKLSSRSGLSISPSLNASLTNKEKEVGVGVGLSTSYNSRTGIKDLTLSSQTSIYNNQNNKEEGEKFRSDLVTTSGTIGSSTFSFARPSYMPSLRMPMENSNTTGQVELGGGIFGFRGSATANGYYSESKVAPEAKLMTKPLVGFIYAEKAIGNKDAVMDFNRLNDAEVTPNTPVISAPQYAYDIFSIQGEGTGGSIRAYRGDLGFMRDNVTLSKDKNISIGADIATPGHFGGNWNVISSPTKAGGWDDANNTLNRTLAFKPAQPGSISENVYFRNPGEATVTNSEMINRIGGDNLVRFKLGGSNVLPRLESVLELFNKKTGAAKGLASLTGNNMLASREKRTQVTTMLTAKEAGEVGLDRFIRSYTGAFSTVNNLVYDSVARVGSYRKAHHISEINVLEQSGMRYVYGLPVYSVKQKDFTFSVDNISGYKAENLVTYDTTSESTLNSRHMANSSKIDGYLQIQETPAYASSFLITGLLSPDYVDVTGNGITEDDLGSSVKFNYTKSADLHKWRTPRKNIVPGSNKDLANFSEGIRTEKKDNKAIISYGEREAWYLNAIESKSMIAIFKTDTRNDAKGVKSQFNGNVNANENANKKLARIDLYTKAEIKAKGILNAKPLKSVLFDYGYALCKGSPDNANGGKLTLRSVYFIFNGQNRVNKDRYVFNYGDTSTINSFDNPGYKYNSADRWGTYKDSSAINNPYNLSNTDFPYTDTVKIRSDRYAAAWSLKKILLPSGGQMEIQYEADDYAYVQNRRACNMFRIAGLGRTPGFLADSAMYQGINSNVDNNFVYIRLPRNLDNTEPAKKKREIYTKYLEGINQLAFKLMVMMPGGDEPLTVYANYDDYGFSGKDGVNDIIYLKLRQVEGKSPLAKSAIGYLTGNLPGQAFPEYESEVNTLPEFISLAGNMLSTLKEAFKNVDEQMRNNGKARSIILGSSFIRLNNPDRIKYGGGVRVKRVTMQDNWNKMTNQYNSLYGQDYTYTAVEKIEGGEMVMSSGVASYEPGIGSEENPFREIETFKNKLPLASAQYGAIEMPMLEGLYPAAGVGYSKVTVRSIHRKGTHADSAVRSAIGKQVTEFYTAKDYPSFSTYTPMVSFDYNKNPFYSFLNKEIINRRTISQGFLVETNDMHGKMKSQAAYSESDEKTPVSASYHTYKNTGKNGLNDQVDFVYNDLAGLINKGNMGIDMELMTDVREFKIESNGSNIQAQVDVFPFGPFIFTLPTIFPLNTYQENLYRAVTCTKLINYHAIEDSVIVMDKGSVIGTKTIVYDAETGSALVTETANEFNDPVYNVSYPAHWAYSGTGLAYKNIGRCFTAVNFYDGKILASSNIDTTIFESGDELYITTQGSGTSNSCIAPSAGVFKLWAFDRKKNDTALTVPFKDLVFLDSAGRLFTKNGVGFKIVRSGKRNMLGFTVSTATCMKIPVQGNSLNVNSVANVVTASAVEYKEKWQVDNDVMLRKTYYKSVCSPIEQDSIDCNGILEKNINPYLKGLVGNFRPYRSYAYYGSRNDSNVNMNTAIRKNGYLYNFSNLWSFNAYTNLVPDFSNSKWVWNSELTKVNSKGQELETRDALNRYTAAQYGFNKNLPVAVVQNARFGESFNEGFEDANYLESINPTSNLKSCDINNYISCNGLTNISIANTDTMAVKAHSGKYILEVKPNAQAKTLNVKTTNIPGYNFNAGRDTTQILNTLGGNFSFVSYTGTYSSPPVSSFGVSNFSVTIYPSNSAVHYYSAYCSTYIKIATQGTYNFYMGINTSAFGSGTAVSYNNAMNVKMYDLNNNRIHDTTISKTIGVSSTPPFNYSIVLCPGIYKISAGISKFYNQPYNPFGSIESYTWQCTNSTSPDYKSLTTVGGCISTKPIPATDSMLNNTFSIIPGKRMQFSAWVREDCTTPCFKADYVNSNIEIWCNGSKVSGGTVKRTGAIIEGWQKVEGEFTPPANTTTAELRFVNSGSTRMYVDDIRIHPFNANMKSYVYDPRSLKLSAELDENNYASFYEYDEEGQLVRIKKETIQGIKTIKETRSAKQKVVTDVQ